MKISRVELSLHIIYYDRHSFSWIAELQSLRGWILGVALGMSTYLADPMDIMCWS